MPSDKEMPEWAKKIEDWGEHFWNKAKTDKKVQKKSKRANYITTIVFNVIVIYIFNNLLNWHISWLTTEFIVPLWVLNLSFGATILFNLFYIFYDAKWFRTLGQFFINLISLTVILVFYQIFPFLLSASHENLLKTVLIILGALTLIGILVEFIKLLSYLIKFIIKNL